MKAKVSNRAVLARINRKLAKNNQVLKKSRGNAELNKFKSFYIVDLNTNSVINTNRNLAGIAEELDCLAGWEELG